MESVKKSSVKRLPHWVKKPSVRMSSLHKVKKVLRERSLKTVCESARCPNIGECFSKPTATFMILGEKCTRDCGFCSVPSAKPEPVDGREPENIALACVELKLKHVVITSVTRDDLTDGGATQFALTIKAIRDTLSDISIELLIPDFNGDFLALEVVLDARPDIVNHNLETVPSLYNLVRPGADYSRSLELIKSVSEAGFLSKSGIMLGFGESTSEVHSLIDDLVGARCRIITIGQYLRPTRGNLEVKEYVLPEFFASYGAYAKKAGIDFVYCGPMVRSSYNAEEIWTNFTG